MDSLRLNIPSPVQKVNHPFLIETKISLFVKREDLIHPTISGNKWRKLKYNLQQFSQNKNQTIVTFGGAFSNHIFSTAAACQIYNIPCIGIIRGEYDPKNPTLRFAAKCGMQLKFIDRSSYREKENSTAVKKILSSISDYILIPEGGSNSFAYRGLKELSDEINTGKENTILVSSGTGRTAAGILKHLDNNKYLHVYSSLKSDFLKKTILVEVEDSKHNQLRFYTNYNLGGYGKIPTYLIQFINDFYHHTRIPLDPIYNGKLMYGFFDQVKNKKIDCHKSYLWIHTGGLQGIDAYNYMAVKKGKMKIKK